MIEGVLEKLKDYEENCQRQDKIETYLVDEKISQEDLKVLRELLEEKIKNRIGEQDVQYDEYALQLMNLLDEVYTQDFNLKCSSQIQYKESDLVSQFFEAMNSGDYVTAFQCVSDNKWNEETENHPNNKHLIFYKSLLVEMNTVLYKKYYLECLGELKRLVEFGEYSSAYYYFQDNFSDYEKMESKEGFDKLLFLLNGHQRVEALLDLMSYQEAYFRGDFSQAKEWLDLYREKIRNTGLDRELDYYYKDLQCMENESISLSFVEKEQLYDYAKYLFDNQEYQKCIEQLNKYILLDEDMSAKGYFLRGRVFEELEKYDEAKADYEKAISIVPDPRTFQRLGKICCGQGFYQDGINNLLECEKRNPQESFDSLSDLACGYQGLGDPENYDKYSHLAENAKGDQAKTKKLIQYLRNLLT